MDMKFELYTNLVVHGGFDVYYVEYMGFPKEDVDCFNCNDSWLFVLPLDCKP